jgi:hypothetical protein
MTEGGIAERSESVLLLDAMAWCWRGSRSAMIGGRVLHRVNRIRVKNRAIFIVS